MTTPRASRTTGISTSPRSRPDRRRRGRAVVGRAAGLRCHVRRRVDRDRTGPADRGRHPHRAAGSHDRHRRPRCGCDRRDGDPGDPEHRTVGRRRMAGPPPADQDPGETRPAARPEPCANGDSPETITGDSHPIEVTPRPFAAGDDVAVTLKRAAVQPTPDQALWVAIRNSTDAIGFESYSRFIEGVICGEPDEDDSRRDREARGTSCARSSAAPRCRSRTSTATGS